MRTPYKMKGYNYPGTSPVKKTGEVEKYAEGEKFVGTKDKEGSYRTPSELRSLADRAEKDGNSTAASNMRKKADHAEKQQISAKEYLDI
tara:strand:- start:40 stop:306 length:267 start_codon:yes stop_codon:yes gene_type:complete